MGRYDTNWERGKKKYFLLISFGLGHLLASTVYFPVAGIHMLALLGCLCDPSRGSPQCPVLWHGWSPLITVKHTSVHPSGCQHSVLFLGSLCLLVCLHAVEINTRLFFTFCNVHLFQDKIGWSTDSCTLPFCWTFSFNFSFLLMLWEDHSICCGRGTPTSEWEASLSSWFPQGFVVGWGKGQDKPSTG